MNVFSLYWYNFLNNFLSLHYIQITFTLNLFVGDILILKSNYSSFICWGEHYTYVHSCACRAKESALTRTTGQMYEGNRVWSLKAPPSHSGFTLDAHLLWSYGGEEKHKNCGCNPSVGLSMSNVSSMKDFGGESLSWQDIYNDCLTGHSASVKKLSICISVQNISPAEITNAAL